MWLVVQHTPAESPTDLHFPSLPLQIASCDLRKTIMATYSYSPYITFSASPAGKFRSASRQSTTPLSRDTVPIVLAATLHAP
jgi:hypothetical protein